jgi:fructuronate reductase
MPRLANVSLDRLPAAIQRPGYDRSRLQTGIVHLGIGAFHRAHQAVMTEAVLNAGDLGWGILGASLRSTDTRDALAPQDGLYTVITRGAGAPTLQVIGAIRGVIVAPENPEALIRAMADPAVHVVTLTVTEKGYCHDPATGALNEAHPDIVHDLKHPRAPRSAPGYLLAALARRRAAGVPPFSIVSCDNLPANGRVLNRVLARMASLQELAFGDYVRERVACPCTMVDRIVPATTEIDRAEAAAALGTSDAWPVAAEPFCQWVIEDRFGGPRPAWEKGGATIVADVAPYEFMKLRLLNGAHSPMAYLGYLAGHETIAEAANDPAFPRYLAGLWAEVIPTVPPPPGVHLAAYTRALLGRFQNLSIRHRTWQVAMDGSQKLPQRGLATIRDRRRAGAPIPHLALGIAAWMRYVMGTDEKGQPIDIRDPLSGAINAALPGCGRDPRRIVKALTGLNAMFAADIAGDATVITAFEQALDAILSKGVRGAMAALAGGEA